MGSGPDRRGSVSAPCFCRQRQGRELNDILNEPQAQAVFSHNVMFNSFVFVLFTLCEGGYWTTLGRDGFRSSAVSSVPLQFSTSDSVRIIQFHIQFSNSQSHILNFHPMCPF